MNISLSPKCTIYSIPMLICFTPDQFIFCNIWYELYAKSTSTNLVSLLFSPKQSKNISTFDYWYSPFSISWNMFWSSQFLFINNFHLLTCISEIVFKFWYYYCTNKELHTHTRIIIHFFSFFSSKYKVLFLFFNPHFVLKNFFFK